MEFVVATSLALYFIRRAVVSSTSKDVIVNYKGPSKASLLVDRATVLGFNMELNYAKSPLLIVRGLGAFLYDETGAAYLDGVNNVAHVGHSHPKILAAIRSQYELLITNSRYVHPHIVTYAKRLVETFPQPLRVVFWVNSGSEANDLALRLARAHTGRRGLIAVDGAYHGHTQAVVDISPYKFDREGYSKRHGPRGHVKLVPQPDSDSGLFRGDASDPAVAASLSASYAATVAEALQSFAADEAAETAWKNATDAGRDSVSVAAAAAANKLSAKRNDVGGSANSGTAWAARVTCDDGLRAGVGAFIMESILSCGGQVLPPKGYLEKVYKDVRAAGGVCIADEVQVGFGRVGAPHWWAFQLGGSNVVPDIVTLGKPIGNGFPCAAVVTTAEIAKSFADGMDYFNTFAGSPVAGAVCHAVLDVIEEEHLRENAARVGAILLDGLKELALKYTGSTKGNGPNTPPIIGSIRGAGFMLGVELVSNTTTRAPDAVTASKIKYKMLKRKILISTDGEFFGYDVIAQERRNNFRGLLYLPYPPPPPLYFTLRHA